MPELLNDLDQWFVERDRYRSIVHQFTESKELTKVDIVHYNNGLELKYFFANPISLNAFVKAVESAEVIDRGERRDMGYSVSRRVA